MTVTFQPTKKGAALAAVRIEYAGPPGLPLHVICEGSGIGPHGEELLVNAGGGAYLDSLGQDWAPDYGAAGGVVFFTPDVVAGTPDSLLYQEQRVAAEAYALPIPSGTYDVTLHFAEAVFGSPGKRVFDVLVEGELVLDDLDLLAVAGFQTAYSTTWRTTVRDGVLDVAFEVSVGPGATISAVEARSAPLVVGDQSKIDFGAVASGSSAQQTLTLTNGGSADATIDTLSFLLGPAGSGEAFSADFQGVPLAGGASDVSYSVNAVLQPGESLPVPLTFAPTQDQYDEITLRFAGDYGELDTTLTGLGGHQGHPHLHVVIDVDPVIVDYDGDGVEDVILDGAQSHTHEPGHALTAPSWSEGGQEISMSPVDVVSFALGQHEVTLTIFDDNVPAESLSDVAQFEVLTATDIPGVLVRYHDGSGLDLGELMHAPPATADFAEVVPTPLVDGLTTIGGSPFAKDVVVRMDCVMDVPADGTYELQISGGSQRLLFLARLQVTGPVFLPAGAYALEARFAVNDSSELPLEVLVGVDGGAVGPIEGSWLVHDESALLPVINSMPALGTSLGGNLITIDGLGYFPSDQVIVNWGSQQFDDTIFDVLTPSQIQFVSPAGSGVIDVTVTTPQGVSNLRTFTYDPDGPVPTNFVEAASPFVEDPTTGAWGPDGRFYVGTGNGWIHAFEFDEDYQVISETTFSGVSTLADHHILGITFNPFDAPDPVRIYVAHGELWVNGGTTFTGPSPYTGKVSILAGPTFDSPLALITKLPTSNHDHGVNGLQFDNNGDLLICMGGNTNAGVKHPNSGDLPESPFSGAILKAETSRSDFDGGLAYVETFTGVPNDDQVFGEIVDVVPGKHVTVHVPGLRNPYDIVYTTARRLYATDNGPNPGFGAASTGPTSEIPDPWDKDEVLLVEYDNYYGHPNRNRGRYDPRQYVYRGTSEPDIPGEFVQAIELLGSSVDGITEYRSNTFQGQMRGDLLIQKWGSFIKRLVLTPDGRDVAAVLDLYPWTGGLDVELGPGGALMSIGFGVDSLVVLVPNDLSAVGLVVHDVHPWRAPATGGHPFVIGGVGFGDLTVVSVTFDGVPAVLTAVTAKRIEGFVPAHPLHDAELVNIVVQVGPDPAVLPDAFRFLYPPGNEPGWWEDVTDMPTALGEVAVGEIDGILYVVGEGSAQTLRYDLVNRIWLSNAAPRTFAGHHHGAEVVGGKLYLIGGLGGFAEGKVQIYDPAGDSWTTGTDMTWAGGSVSTAAIGGLIYAVGGIVSQTTVANAAVYDPVADSWAPLAPLPVGRNHTAAGTDGQRMFVFGGRDGDNVVANGFDDVQIYDPATDSWEWDKDVGSTLAPLPQFRGGMGKAVWYRDELYVFGGETFDGPGAIPGKRVYDRVDVYDPAANTWRLEAPMPTPRHGVFPILYQSRMLLPGGGENAGFAQTAAFDSFTRQ
ncbi:MAG: malectin domain-containing carbohydrate-binding protein [Planctomycetota bacterium]|nr:malectin domain-containing carbohydrate-binding protein [Planctomycetota bacterium]